MCNRCGSNKHLANASDQLLKLNAINNCICQSSTLVHEVLPEVQICNTNCDNSTDRIKCLVRISTETGLSMETEFVVDTGSAVSILPEILDSPNAVS